MIRRFGNIFYWLGSSLAILAIVAAVVLNTGAIQQRQDARKNLSALASEATEMRATLPQAYSNARASAENLKRTLKLGGFWIFGGLIAYGLGLVARYVSRMPESARKK